MIFKRIVFCLLLISMQAIGLKAQYSGLDLLDGKDKKEVDFEYVNGFIIVKVIYAGILPLNFILDTGASHNILLKKNANDILGIPYTDTITIRGADLDGHLTALVSRSVPIMLRGTETIQRDIIVLQKDYVDLNMVIGMRIDGILGGDFLKGLTISIDYRRRKLTIYNPNKFYPNKNFKKKKINVINYKPYLLASTNIENKIDTLNYLLDTGAALPLLIHSNKTNTLSLPNNLILGNLGKGLTGDLTGYIGMINQVDVLDFQFRDVITSFQEIDTSFRQSEVIRNGLIGNDILSRFHIIIDYVNEYVYLKATSKIKDEFAYDKSGLLIYALGEHHDQYFIKNVYPNTPAHEAGILPGDRILKIGCWPLRFYSLSDIKEKLQKKDGKKIKMKILRKGSEMKVEFKLRNLFKNKDLQE